MKSDVVFSHKSDDWSTPVGFYRSRMESGFFDPCPLRAGFDGLDLDWSDYEFLFCNPPYSNISAFVDKAIKEHQKYLKKYQHYSHWGCFGASEAVCSTTYYLPSRMSVRLMVKMYQAEYGYRLSDFTLRYFNTGLIISKDCDAPHFNVIDVDVAEAIA